MVAKNGGQSAFPPLFPSFSPPPCPDGLPSFPPDEGQPRTQRLQSWYSWGSEEPTITTIAGRAVAFAQVYRFTGSVMTRALTHALTLSLWHRAPLCPPTLCPAGMEPNPSRGPPSGTAPIVVVVSSRAKREGSPCMRRSADPNEACTDDGGTALMQAAQDGYLEVTRLLLDRSADPNQLSTTDGVPALILAAKKGCMRRSLTADHQAARPPARNSGRRRSDRKPRHSNSGSTVTAGTARAPAAPALYTGWAQAR